MDETARLALLWGCIVAAWACIGLKELYGRRGNTAASEDWRVTGGIFGGAGMAFWIVGVLS